MLKGRVSHKGKSHAEITKIWVKNIFTQTCFFIQIMFFSHNFEPKTLQSQPRVLKTQIIA